MSFYVYMSLSIESGREPHPSSACSFHIHRSLFISVFSSAFLYIQFSFHKERARTSFIFCLFLSWTHDSIERSLFINTGLFLHVQVSICTSLFIHIGLYLYYTFQFFLSHLQVSIRNSLLFPRSWFVSLGPQVYICKRPLKRDIWKETHILFT